MKTFRRGRSTFNCGVCERLTRETGAQSMGSDLCPQCWDLAGIENEISDGHATIADRRAEVDRLIAEVAAKGGDVASWHSTFPAEVAQP